MTEKAKPMKRPPRLSDIERRKRNPIRSLERLGIATCPTCDGSGLQLTGNVDPANGVEEVGGCYDCAGTGALNFADQEG